MAQPHANPVARRWELAARLRTLRNESGLTVEQVAAKLLVSATKISRMETAARGVSLRDVRDLCDLYAVPEGQRAELTALAQRARERSWWQSYPAINTTRSDFIGLESAASAIRQFQPTRVPGLLQTQGYARALLAPVASGRDLSEKDVEDILEVRARRQALLVAKPPPFVHAVIDEAALRRAVGGAGVMAEQVHRLIECAAQLPNLRLQVLPFAKGAHPAIDGNFVLLHTAADSVADVVFIEGLITELFLDREADVAWYSATLDRLAREAALSPEESIGFLEGVERDWRRT
jgi:transcriptional regulator with XRE-family HTH domain